MYQEEVNRLRRGFLLGLVGFWRYIGGEMEEKEREKDKGFVGGVGWWGVERKGKRGGGSGARSETEGADIDVYINPSLRDSVPFSAA